MANRIPHRSPQAPYYIFEAAQAARLNQYPSEDGRSLSTGEVLALAATLKSFSELKGQGPHIGRKDGPIVQRHRTTGYRQAMVQARGVLLDNLVQDVDPDLLKRTSRSGAQDQMEQRIFHLATAIRLRIFDLTPDQLLDIQSWKTPIEDPAE